MVEKRVAVTLPGGPKVSDTIARAQWAEAEGYSDAWLADGGALDAMTLAAILGDHTERLRVGIAVTPVYTRAPSVLAATAYTVAQQLPGRFVMGLGSSSKTMMTGWNGIPLEKPLTRVSETVRLVKSMLAGEKSDFAGETLQSRGYRQPPLESPPPVYMAALRSKMIEEAAAVSDGVIFNLWPKLALPKMMEHVALGAARGGKAERPEVVNRFMVCVTDDKDRGPECLSCLLRALLRDAPVQRLPGLGRLRRGRRCDPRGLGGKGPGENHRRADRPAGG